MKHSRISTRITSVRPKELNILLGEWISVKNVLPREFVSVLIFSNPKWLYPVVGNMIGSDWYSSGSYEEDYKNMNKIEDVITHWMLLPNSPND